GYNSLDIGTTVFVTGIAQLFGTVLVARASQRVDPRKIITLGLVLFAGSLWMTSQLTAEWGFGAFLLPQALRGLAVMMCIVPSVT
ncbi:MFS transporter, partial [Lysobacter sp. 2RAB21]